MPDERTAVVTEELPVAADGGTLYLVPTPIGNPRDLSLRAIDVLGQVGLIAAEDTRHARSLLQPLGIQTRLISYHDHNEEVRAPQLLDALAGGTDVALISDAGTPMVNDPGFRVVIGAIQQGSRVSPLPGPSAAVTGLIGSGLPVHSFHYAGFLPRRSAARQASVRRLAGLQATLIFFEAPHRLLEMVSDLHAVLGDRPAALARNLTKRGEDYQRGNLSELVALLAEQDSVRGEYTVLVGGAGPEPAGEAQAQADRIIEVLLDNGAGGRLVREAVRELTGLPRNWVYERVQAAETDRRQPG
jgi:16S rRNA (cytidine1402-2'-O)-methyltransferase